MPLMATSQLKDEIAFAVMVIGRFLIRWFLIERRASGPRFDIAHHIFSSCGPG
jgi:hypothetical protein